MSGCQISGVGYKQRIKISEMSLIFIQSKYEPFRSDEQWLTVDLGTGRSVLKVAFRGGYYKGVSCTPGQFSPLFRNINYQELATIGAIELKVNLKTRLSNDYNGYL